MATNTVESVLSKFGIELIDGWQKFYRLYTFWFLLVLGSLGDILNALDKAGISFADKTPDSVTTLLNIIAAMGIIARVIRQKKLQADILATKAS